MDKYAFSEIMPVRIVKCSDSVSGENNLLKPKDQIAFDEQEKLIFNGAGSFVIDFGAEYFGVLRLLTGNVHPENHVAKIRITLGESLAECCAKKGYKNNYNFHGVKDMDFDTFMFSEIQTGYSGFRFAKIELINDVKFEIINCKIIARQDNLKRVGYFECNDERVNKIFDTAARTVELCQQNGYIWDGIKRDRIVWVGDLHPESLSIMLLSGDYERVYKSLTFVQKYTPLPGWINGIMQFKDIEIIKEEKEKPVECDYSFTHAVGDARNDVLTIPAADFNLQEGDKVTVTLKLKSNISNVYAVPVYVTNLGDRTTGSEYKLSTYTDWTEVSFKMTVTTGATAKLKVMQSWDTFANSTVDENAVGLFFFILNSSSCYNQSLWAKDVTVKKIEDEKPTDYDYSYTHADGDTRNDVLMISAADFNLKEGDKVKVTLKLKSNISNEYAMPVYVTDLGDRTTGSEYKLSTYTDWTEVSFKMTVTTGATAKLKVMQSWDTFANSTVDENAVGLFFFILNSSSCYNQSLWAKDVTIEKLP